MTEEVSALTDDTEERVNIKATAKLATLPLLNFTELIETIFYFYFCLGFAYFLGGGFVCSDDCSCPLEDRLQV